MKLFRNLLVLIVVFSAGFACRSLISESNWARITSSISNANTVNLQTASTDGSSQFITYVNFDGKNFKPNYVTIKRSYILAITNSSKTDKMWLESTASALTTTRAYGESERHQVELDVEGEFKVDNKLNPDQVLYVKVVK